MNAQSAWKLIACVALSAVVVSPVAAQSGGIAGREAPLWRVDEWFNLPDGSTSINIDDFEGQVVYLYCFQSWCPGCHSRGFPTLQELINRFDGVEDVAFVAVQTTFEGFHTNTPENALKTAERYELDIPVGHSGADGRRSRLMSDYRTRGTPWTVIIDPSGIVRFNDFHITPDRAERLINTILVNADDPHTDTDSAEVEIETLPKDRGGQDLIGTRMPHLDFDRWIRGGPRDPAPEDVGEAAARRDPDKEPKATLYRWWTDTCRFCEASLPAIEQLRRQYADHGLRVVAVYHPKPPREVEDDAIATAAEERGFHGDIALDLDWSALEWLYLSTGHRNATSASFLVDSEGIVRFVHPGPELFPSEDRRFAKQNEDYQLLREAIDQVIGRTTSVP